MNNAIIPKFVFDIEDITFLKDKGIQVQEGNQIIGKMKVPCYKFLNLSETEVFDKLDGNALLEATNENEKNSYAARVVSILFIRVRQINTIKDSAQKNIALTALTAAVNSLATFNINYAKRFLPLLRAI